MTLPGRGQGRGGAADSDLRAALEACRQCLPKRPGFGATRGDDDSGRGGGGGDGPNGGNGPGPSLPATPPSADGSSPDDAI